MGWAKFDDQFTDHPKVVQAGPMAELLHMRAVIYCARHETDGLVVEAALSRLAIGVTSPKKQVAALVTVGLWDEDPEGWRIHDFLEYHPSREEKDRERAEARERMQKARSKKRSWNVRANTPRTEEEQAANNGRSSRNPDPTRPDPVVSTHSDQTPERGNALDPAVQSEIQSIEPRFKSLRRRGRWPDYEFVLADWAELGPQKLARAVGVFCQLSTDGYADTPKLLRRACEKVSTQEGETLTEAEWQAIAEGNV